jgi:hypothetical protein
VHRTVRCTPDSVRCPTGQCPVHQRTPARTRHLREFLEALRYNSPDCPVYTGQCPVLQRSASSGTRQPREFDCSRSAIIHRTVRCTPDCPVNHGATATSAPTATCRRSSCPVCTGHPGGPTSQKLQRSESNGSVTWQGAPDCPVCTGLSGAPSNRQLLQRLQNWMVAINTTPTGHFKWWEFKQHSKSSS